MIQGLQSLYWAHLNPYGSNDKLAKLIMFQYTHSWVKKGISRTLNTDLDTLSKYVCRPLCQQQQKNAAHL